MNPAADLLASLAARGVAVRLEPPDRLLVTPAALLTPADREAIAAHKTALLDLLWEAIPVPEEPNWNLEDLSVWAARHNEGAREREARLLRRTTKNGKTASQKGGA